jgi:hypothetical protein
MEKYRLMLTLFGEGGGASGGAAAGAGGEGAGGAAGAQTQGAPAQQTVDRAAEFDKLIKGEYKEEYDKRFKQGLDRRFKETESLRQQTEAAKPLMELLAGKYGVDANDLGALMKAAEADESYYEEEAAQKGLTVQQLKQFKQMERENAQLRAAQEERQRVERANQVQARWMQEADALKGIYPNFDFETETDNATFVKLLKSGLDVRTAYEVAHHDEIISGAMQFTAQKVKEKTVNDIRARGMRPNEGGLGEHPAGEGQLDVTKLTRQQRAEMAKRASRGEIITL